MKLSPAVSRLIAHVEGRAFPIFTFLLGLSLGALSGLGLFAVSALGAIYFLRRQ